MTYILREYNNLVQNSDCTDLLNKLRGSNQKQFQQLKPSTQHISSQSQNFLKEQMKGFTESQAILSDHLSNSEKSNQLSLMDKNIIQNSLYEKLNIILGNNSGSQQNIRNLKSIEEGQQAIQSSRIGHKLENIKDGQPIYEMKRTLFSQSSQLKQSTFMKDILEMSKQGVSQTKSFGKYLNFHPSDEKCKPRKATISQKVMNQISNLKRLLNS